jgi:hypothetical protein
VIFFNIKGICHTLIVQSIKNLFIPCHDDLVLFYDVQSVIFRLNLYGNYMCARRDHQVTCGKLSDSQRLHVSAVVRLFLFVFNKLTILIVDADVFGYKTFN